MGASQNRGTVLGVPIIRTTVFWGLYCPPILGNYHIDMGIDVDVDMGGGALSQNQGLQSEHSRARFGVHRVSGV